MFRIIFLTICLCMTTVSFSAIVLGNPQGSVTMIEVIDYQCPHCQQSFPVVQELIDKNPELKVRLMPVAILNDLSISEAAAVIVSSRYPGKFQLLNNSLMVTPPKSQQDVIETLKNFGLMSSKFVSLMKSDEVKKQMEEGIQFLKSEQSGTPLFVLYPTRDPKLSAVLKGFKSISRLQKTIDEAKSHV